MKTEVLLFATTKTLIPNFFMNEFIIQEYEMEYGNETKRDSHDPIHGSVIKVLYLV